MAVFTEKKAGAARYAGGVLGLRRDVDEKMNQRIGLRSL